MEGIIYTGNHYFRFFDSRPAKMDLPLSHIDEKALCSCLLCLRTAFDINAWYFNNFFSAGDKII